MRIAKTLVCMFIALLVLYLVWSVFIGRDYRIGESGMRDRYRNLIANDLLKNDWKKLNCTMNLSSSLAQSLHIVKSWNGVFCAEELKGERYGSLKKPFSCNSEDAMKIDEAVRRRGDCAFPIDKPLRNEVSNYHAFVFVCVADFTSWKYVGGGHCPQEYPQSIVYAVVDEEGNVSY